MFDLEKAIANWIRQLRKNPSFEDGDIEEIEDHIREEIEKKHEAGLSYEKAFDSTIISFGSPKAIGDELTLSRTKNLRRPARFNLEPSFTESTSPIRTSLVMTGNYLKTLIRVVRKDKLYSFLTITSLSLGLFPCVLLLLLLQYEYSFDTYHKDTDRIYRIAFDGYTMESGFKTINTSPKLEETIQAEFPDAGETMMLFHPDRAILMKHGDQVFNETSYLYAGKNLFGFFDIELEQGNPETALEKHHTMVVTKRFAKKYFGDENPVGKMMDVELWVRNASAFPWGDFPNPSGIDPGGDYIITGVVKDMPPTSHIQFDFLMSMETLQWWDMWRRDLFFFTDVATYIKLAPNVSQAQFEQNLNSIIDKYHAHAIEYNLEVDYAKFLADGKKLKYSLIPLADLHFEAAEMRGVFEKLGVFNNVYYLSIIAIVAVLIGCINFINLSTASSSNRLKEIGIRKVSGSGKLQLLFQFLFESVVMTFCGLVLGLLIVVFVLPYFNSFLDTQITVRSIATSWALPVALCLAILVGLISGIYPSYVISRSKPALIIKGNTSNSIKGKAAVRNALVFFQYGISILFIMGALVVYQQLNYMHNKDLGFDREQVLILEGSQNLNFLTRPTSAKYLELKSNLGLIDGVKCVTGSMRFFGVKGLVHNFLRPVETDLDAHRSIYLLGFGDFNVLENFNIPIVEQLKGDRPAKSYYLTESAVKELGIENPIGQSLIRSSPYEIGRWSDDLDTVVVAGIIKDIQYSSANSAIEPVALVLINDKDYGQVPMHTVYIKLKPENMSATVSEIESKWKEMFPDQPFLYSFLDEKINTFYAREERLGKLIGLFSILSVVISCLGIFGLSAFLGKQKSKEISIRKIFGASIIHVIGILISNYSRLIGLALIIFIPLTYLLAERWLEAYPFRITISSGIVLMTMGAMILITSISVSWQLIKGITESPLETIRNE